MRILFVAPSSGSSGEAITALHAAESITAEGGAARFLASEHTAGFLRERLPGSVESLSDEPARNRRLWSDTIAGFQPQAIVFADYPLLFFERGTPPLADERWVAELERGPAVAVTFDHLGYAQRSIQLHFGPPHLSFHCETVRPAPEWMHVLLPCPLHEPDPIPGRRGSPFRYWQPPALSDEERDATRAELVPEPAGRLVLHSTPSWASRFAREFRLPYYDLLPELLEHHFAGLEQPVTVVSVNGESLLSRPPASRTRFRNLATRSAEEFERLLLAADLVLTENGVSSTLGKAVCAGVPAAVLRNSLRLSELLAAGDGPLQAIARRMEEARTGAVFPYTVFPIWGRRELQQLGLYEGNTITRCIELLEAFGERTGGVLSRLLADTVQRERRRAGGRDYARRVERLPGPAEALRRLVGAAA